MKLRPCQKIVAGIHCADSGCRTQAREYCALLRLPHLSQPATTYPQGRFLLAVDSDGLSLQFTGKKSPRPIRADFLSGATAHRRLYGGGRGQLIAKAVGIKQGYQPRMVDLTAGLGQDAFVLATLGCRITMLERVDVVYALLLDGLKRAQNSACRETTRIIERMELIHQNARVYLQVVEQAPDVIYFDPMFPDRGKSAKVKKAMAAFQQIIGSDDDAGDVLALALKAARYRVVVKRPRKAPSLDQQYPQLNLPKPGLVLPGKSSRFDVYPLKTLAGGGKSHP